MPKDFILVDNTKAGASLSVLLKNAASFGRQYYSALLSIRAQMTHLEDNVDFTQIETMFGLDVGKGQIVFDLVNGSIGAIEGTMQNAQNKTMTEQLF